MMACPEKDPTAVVEHLHNVVNDVTLNKNVAWNKLLDTIDSQRVVANLAPAETETSDIRLAFEQVEVRSPLPSDENPCIRHVMNIVVADRQVTGHGNVDTGSVPVYLATMVYVVPGNQMITVHVVSPRTIPLEGDSCSTAGTDLVIQHLDPLRVEDSPDTAATDVRNPALLDRAILTTPQHHRSIVSVETA